VEPLAPPQTAHEHRHANVDVPAQVETLGDVHVVENVHGAPQAEHLRWTSLWQWQDLRQHSFGTGGAASPETATSPACGAVPEGGLRADQQVEEQEQEEVDMEQRQCRRPKPGPAPSHFGFVLSWVLVFSLGQRKALTLSVFFQKKI